MILTNSGDLVLAQLHMNAEVVRWERALSGADLEHVFLKGIGFDVWLDRSTTRVSRDIDLFCPPPASQAAARLLKAQGFRCLVTEPNASTWVGPDGRVPVDLHETLKGAGASATEVWRAVEPLITFEDVGGVSVPFLGTPARELLVALHVVFAGVGDERAMADFLTAVDRTSRDTWRAADELARRLACRGLFEAAFGVTDDLRALGTALGFSPAGAGDLMVPRPGRDDTLALLAVFAAAGVRERARLTGRFLHLHAARLGRAGAIGPGHSFAERLRSAGAVGITIARRLFVALASARRLRRVLRARERSIAERDTGVPAN